jgi:hypothetical protein
MIKFIHRIDFAAITRLVLVVASIHGVPVMGQLTTPDVAPKLENHLFILSGQSNMTGNLVKGFSAKVEDAFGKDNVTVAMSMKSGRGIRYWCSDYRFPDHHKPSEQEKADHGSLYKPLLDAVKLAAGDKTFATVTFIWMQGESDAAKGYSEAYAESFMKLFNRLKNDLKSDDMKFVIGRLSDFDMKNQKSPHWTKMREVQVKLAEDHDEGEWIDTDDFIDEDPNASGNLHYGMDASEKLGERFASKAIEMIERVKKSNKPRNTKEQ